jgi:hypothetical protein
MVVKYLCSFYIVMKRDLGYLVIIVVLVTALVSSSYVIGTYASSKSERSEIGQSGESGDPSSSDGTSKLTVATVKMQCSDPNANGRGVCCNSDAKNIFIVHCYDCAVHKENGRTSISDCNQIFLNNRVDEVRGKNDGDVLIDRDTPEKNDTTTNMTSDINKSKTTGSSDTVPGRSKTQGTFNPDLTTGAGGKFDADPDSKTDGVSAYDCNGLTCTCTGDVDCNNMFLSNACTEDIFDRPYCEDGKCYCTDANAR